MEQNIEKMLKRIVISELSKIKINKTIFNYMSDENNWLVVDPDGSIGSDNPLSYPMEVLVLSVKKMPKEVMELIGLDLLKPIEEELSESKIEEIAEKAESEGKELEDVIATGFSAIYANFYWEESISTLDLITENENIIDPEKCFIFNGYDLDENSETDLALKCLNNQEAEDYS
jgi:hypothetical protein